MANELTLSVSVSFNKGGIAVSMQSGTKQCTVSGSDYAHATMTVPTSAAVLPLGSVGTPGYCMIVNRDSTNFVEVYTAVAGAAALRLKPGEWQLFRFATAAPAVKADTAAVVIEYLVIED